jgi:tRNA modification GTPase
MTDTIAALASPPGAAGRGIIRISGPATAALIRNFVHPADSPAVARRFTGEYRVPGSPAPIPVNVLFWPTQRSYTGQPVAELHLPGSPPVLEKVLEDLYRRGARPARPGEFTLRAFLAGKIDLLQAEAVLGVIDAHDDRQLRTALEQLAGGISGRLMRLRGDLVELLADLEAGLDFVEEDIEFVTRGEMRTRIATARAFVESLREQTEARMTSAVLPKVVLAGLPNAGKSTLFNRLAGEALALVSARQGTTRDYLRAELDWGGVRFELIDTAGWETGVEGLSAAAQAQRSDQVARAALILWCTASDRTDSERMLDDFAFESSTAEKLRIVTKCELLRLPSGGRQGRVESRESRVESQRAQSESGCSGPQPSTLDTQPNQGADAPRSEEVRISAMTEHGMHTLRQAITRRLSVPSGKTSAWLGMTAVRCRDSLEQAAAELRRAEMAAGEPSAGDELLAIDLREALEHLGHVVGAVYTDDVLDRIFSKFCIGK